MGVLGSFMSGLPLPAAQAVGSWFAQWLSPYQANPFGLNPLRDLIKREVDFDLLAQQHKQRNLNLLWFLDYEPIKQTLKEVEKMTKLK